MSEIIHVTDSAIDPSLLGAHETTVVYFWAPWCGPCRAMSPLLEGLAAERGEEFGLVKVNIDENFELLEAEGITSVPVLKIYRGGEYRRSLVGAQAREPLLAELFG